MDQAPLSMGFSRQECWSGLPFPLPGDLPNPGIEPGSPSLQADALPSEPPGKNDSWAILKNIKLDLKKYWKKDKVLKWNKPEAHETASTDTALLKTHRLDFVLLGSVQMLERGHKDWEGTRGCRMAQEQSGGIRQRKDDAAAMVNATVKFRKRMQTLMKGF